MICNRFFYKKIAGKGKEALTSLPSKYEEEEWLKFPNYVIVWIKCHQIKLPVH